MKYRKWIWLIPVTLVYLAGFVVATVGDLAINRALYTVNLFGVLMESFGWYPAFLPPIFLLVLWATRPGLRPGARWQAVVCGVAAVGGFAGIYAVSYNYLYKRGVVAGAADYRTWLWLVAGALLATLAVVLIARLGPAARGKMQFFFVCGTVLMAANQAVVYPLKTLWQRTRFEDMLADAAHFTPWYQPMGHGGSSFPSGHTANAACILVLLVLCDLYPAWHRRRHLVMALCWGYIAAMAAARIMIGKHFLSDTLAASAIIALLFFALRRTPLYRRALQKTLDKTRQQTTEANDAV